MLKLQVGYTLVSSYHEAKHRDILLELVYIALVHYVKIHMTFPMECSVLLIKNEMS